MNNSDPQPPSEPQLTPVEFSPPSFPEEAIGTVPVAPPPEKVYTFFWPVLLVMLTLNFSVVRDVVSLNKRMAAINEENAPEIASLSKASKQTEFIEALRADVVQLAQTDPYAAQIAKEYFPMAPDKKAAKPDASAQTPAK